MTQKEYKKEVLKSLEKYGNFINLKSFKGQMKNFVLNSQDEGYSPEQTADGIAEMWYGITPMKQPLKFYVKQLGK